MDNGREPHPKTEQGEQSKPRYKLNKRKFAVAMAILCFLTAVLIVIIYYMIGDNAKAVLLTNEPPKNTLTANAAASDTNKAMLKGRIVVVDAGHGGADPGTIGVNGSHEADLNLKVALYLAAVLEGKEAKVVMTRSDENAIAGTKELDMAKRRQIILKNGSDIVISVHMNSYTDQSICGPVVLFMKGSERGKELADYIQQSLNYELDPKSANNARSEDLFILESGSQPCVIMECGYLSNPDEEKKLMQEAYQRGIAKAACNGIIRYFNSGGY